MPCLVQRVFEEGCKGLLGRTESERVLADHANAKRGEQGGELAQLAPVAGGQNELPHAPPGCLRAIAACCASNSTRIPSEARSIMSLA